MEGFRGGATWKGKGCREEGGGEKVLQQQLNEIGPWDFVSGDSLRLRKYITGQENNRGPPTPLPSKVIVSPTVPTNLEIHRNPSNELERLNGQQNSRHFTPTHPDG